MEEKPGWACPVCHEGLTAADDLLCCPRCGARYSTSPFVDFLSNEQPGHTELAAAVDPVWERMRRNEDAGMAFKAHHFYLRELRELGLLESLRVLDDGCGTGMLVDELHKLGPEVWGIDPMPDRQDVWPTRLSCDRLACADGLALPFKDCFFDVVISNGVLEHVGEGQPDRRERRARYVSEALRVLRPGGRLIIGHPNGACPVDFWHGGVHSIRPHRPYEAWMPNAHELRRYVKASGLPATIKLASPKNYVSFLRAGQSPIGRVLMPLGKLVIELADRVAPLRASPINPQLVALVTRLA